MANQVKFASGLHVFGSTADRYVLSGYKSAVPIPEMIRAAAQVPDLQGVELVETWHINEDNADVILAQLEQAGLQLTVLIPDLWASGKWGQGSFTSNDQRIREDAVATVKRAMDLSARVGCNLVDVWLGQDGYDYAFTANYLKAWDRVVEALRECADYRPDVTIGMEYKIKEPRTHCFVGDVGKMLLLFDRVERENLKVILDVGHALAAYESMAESVAVCKYFGDRLVYLHLNDNWRLWDDDMAVGALHTIELLELLYWLEFTGYEGWYSLDIFPYREDGIRIADESIQWLKDMRQVMFNIGLDRIGEVIETGDWTQASKMVREGMFAISRQ
jgi:xylose isomerase